MNKLTLVISLCIFLGISCQNKKSTDKYQKKRNNVINVKNDIVDIKTNILFGYAQLDIIDNVLIATEAFPDGDRGIHLFDKNTYEYITSTAIIGKGPGEVARQGGTETDAKNRNFWVSDHGKMVMWKFSLDSVLNSSNYKPKENRALSSELFIERYGFLNDSITIGKAVRLLPGGGFNMAMVKYNFNTDYTELFGYEHPLAIDKKSNSRFEISPENEIYVNAYVFCDLLTICNLDGTLKYNIYGPGWMKNKDNKNSYYNGVNISGKYIVTLYNGGANIIMDQYNRQKGNYPTKFLIFDLEGNYLKTLETGHKIAFFCLDEENSRIIVYFDDRENPLGYISTAI
jgi:hypothetical protein